MYITFQVDRKHVDNYKPGRRIPHCEFRVKPIHESVSELTYHIELHGAKPPFNEMTVSYTHRRFDRGIINYTKSS